MLDHQKAFIDFALHHGVLKFGEFTLKSGRVSPYFFNTGLFRSGAQLAALGDYYAQTYHHAGVHADMVFGPAYKGIPLVSAVAICLYQRYRLDLPFAFNRKEAKNHGEGGQLVGAPLAGRVLIVDDVITAGTSVRESVALIRDAGAEPCGVLIALDRQETGQGAQSATQEVATQFGLPVHALVTLRDLIDYLRAQVDDAGVLARLEAYRARYGVDGDASAR